MRHHIATLLVLCAACSHAATVALPSSSPTKTSFASPSLDEQERALATLVAPHGQITTRAASACWPRPPQPPECGDAGEQPPTTGFALAVKPHEVLRFVVAGEPSAKHVSIEITPVPASCLSDPSQDTCVGNGASAAHATLRSDAQWQVSLAAGRNYVLRLTEQWSADKHAMYAFGFRVVA